MLFLPLLLVSCSAAGSSAANDSTADETRDRMILSLVERAAATRLQDYNPVYVIDAVNALQPLGREGAWRMIGMYLERRDPEQSDDGLFLLLRVLFDLPPDQCYPEVGLGVPVTPPPPDAGNLPRFPIVMIQDVPIMVVRGYFLGGFPDRVERHVAFFREHGIIRSRPLRLPRSSAAIEDQFSTVWRAAYGTPPDEYLLGFLREQIARLDASR
ncbi:MAG: hypothetical protein JST22_04690 [Bacteroidetes bacterium]|nr:hypothetical protein [Bacteroidota bacterium]